ELNAQTVITTEFGKEAAKRIGDYAQNKELELLAQGNTEEANKWAEGGVYRVALHTLIGVLGTGTVEGAMTTGSVALSAPILNKISQQVIKILIDQGVSPQIAKNAVDLVSNLGIATITELAGAETASTAMAVNVDAFNRQLHANMGEAWVIEELYKRQGNHKKWSREQIANALRAANFKKGSFYESADSHNAVPSNRPDLGYDNLVGVQWNNRGTGISLNIPKVDPSLVAYIQSHTGKGDFASYQYTWDPHRLSNYQEPRPERVRIQQVPLVLESELRYRNAAVMNGADLRGSSNINHASNQAFKNVLNSAERFHRNYNHVTVLSVSNGGFAQTIIINNLNGKVYMSMPIDVSANVKPPNLGNFQTAGASAGFGVALSQINSRQDIAKKAAAIDDIIKGASLGVQACYAACLGGSVASGNQVMILYGVGTPGASLGSSYMVDTGIVLKKSEIARYKSR
ncbi:hypothetical protein SAMN02745664_1261, partial [Moraxella cuniculi DSM 21768]